MASHPVPGSSGMSDSVSRAERLLHRYPDLSEAELTSLLRTFGRLPLLHYGLLAADEQLSDKLDLLYRDHGDKLRTPLSGPAGILSAIAVAALVVFLWTAV